MGHSSFWGSSQSYQNPVRFSIRRLSKNMLFVPASTARIDSSSKGSSSEKLNPPARDPVPTDAQSRCSSISW